MTLVERLALGFTPRNFAQWLLVKRELQNCDFTDEEAITEYFADSGINYALVTDLDGGRFVIHLKELRQEVTFLCWWFASLCDSCGYKHIGQGLNHVFEAIDLMYDYQKNKIIPKPLAYEVCYTCKHYDQNGICLILKTPMPEKGWCIEWKAKMNAESSNN